MNTDINTRALLVSLSISSYNPQRLDRTVTAEVTSAKNASKDAGAYKKQLIPKAVIDPVLKAANAVYLDHKRLTSPWEDGGTRLLSIDMFEKYSDVIAGGIRLFEVEVAKFLRHYEDIRATAPARMGLTFDARDYPPLEKVRDRFGIKTEWTPLPNGSDFRVHLQDGDLAELAASVDSRVNSAVEAARTDLHDRLKDRLSCVSERLADPNKVFRDSLIDNLKDLCQLLPSMCLTRDPDLIRAVDSAVLNIVKFEPQELRDDLDKRASAKAAADSILRSMGGFIQAPETQPC